MGYIPIQQLFSEINEIKERVGNTDQNTIMHIDSTNKKQKYIENIESEHGGKKSGPMLYQLKKDRPDPTNVSPTRYDTTGSTNLRAHGIQHPTYVSIVKKKTT